MAGSITITDQEHRTLRKLLLDWLSDSSGDVNGTLTAIVSGTEEGRRVAWQL